MHHPDGTDAPASTTTTRFSIAGMTCVACAARLERALNRLPDVAAKVDFANEQARVTHPSGDAALALIIKTAKKTGFVARPATSPDGTDAADAQRKANEQKRDIALFVFAAVFTLPLAAQMVLMFAADGTDAHRFMLPAWAQWLLATPVQFVAGARFYRAAWKALRGGSANMDVLVSLGTSIAYLYSAVLVAGEFGGHVYFETSATLITLVLLGKLLEARARRKTSSAVRSLVRLQ
ncbi:MAG: cation transporter, partial [Puniceicoccales bacterium]|nr:cation transporter [Puniceicoccales bacterium]